MKKYLAWLGLLFCISVLVNLEQEHYSYQTASNSGDKSVTVTANNAPNGKENSPEPYNSAQKWWERAYVLFGWPSGITIWALILTMIVIAEQTVETRKSARAALKQARASSKSLALTRHMERGRMAIAVAPLGELSLQFLSKNIGNAYAKVFDGRGYMQMLPQGQSLPEKPPYLAETRESKFIDWIKPGKTFELTMQDDSGSSRTLIADLTSEERRQGIQSGTTMWIYGRICYMDGIDPDDERESRFCFQIVLDKEGHPEAKSVMPSDHYWMET